MHVEYKLFLFIQNDKKVDIHANVFVCCNTFRKMKLTFSFFPVKQCPCLNAMCGMLEYIVTILKRRKEIIVYYLQHVIMVDMLLKHVAVVCNVILLHQCFHAKPIFVGLTM